MQPGQDIAVRAVAADGTETSFTARCRIDTPVEAEYYRHGGILQYVLRGLLEGVGRATVTRSSSAGRHRCH